MLVPNLPADSSARALRSETSSGLVHTGVSPWSGHVPKEPEVCVYVNVCMQCQITDLDRGQHEAEHGEVVFGRNRVCGGGVGFVYRGE